MKKNFSIIFIILTYSIVFGQTNGTTSSYYYNSALSDINNVLNSNTFEINYSRYKGSPYLDKDFKIGTVTNSNEQKNYKFYLRYNIYQDKIEIEKDKKSIVYLGRLQYFNINIDNKKFKLLTYIQKNKTNKGYLEVLATNTKISLYKKYTATLISAKKATSSFEKDQPARFNQSTSFYFKLDDNIVVLPKKKKDFYLIFNKNTSAIKAYIKSNHLKINKEKDLIEIFNHFNSL